MVTRRRVPLLIDDIDAATSSNGEAGVGIGTHAGCPARRLTCRSRRAACSFEEIRCYREHRSRLRGRTLGALRGRGHAIWMMKNRHHGAR